MEFVEETPCDVLRPRVLDEIGCPTLVTLGEHDWLDSRQISEFQHYLSGLKRDITVKCFAGAETAASHAHSDNPTIANEYIFDWISSRLHVL
jgi:hypothetical protein